MGSTIKISKSKNLSFKKLSFLYLVFILFMFFSSPGQFVFQYAGMAVTQASYNRKLALVLKNKTLQAGSDISLRNTALHCCAQVDSLLNDYARYCDENHVTGDKLMENNFVDHNIRRGAIGQKIDAIIRQYHNAYAAAAKHSLDDKLIMPVDFNQKPHQNIDFYFKDTPNGVVNNVLEHYKTVFLYETLLLIKGEEIPATKVEIHNAEKWQILLNSFKKNLVLGEEFNVVVHTRDSSEIPVARINGALVNLDVVNRNKNRLRFTPVAPGNYSVEIKAGNKRVLTSFTVHAPSFRLIQTESNVKGEVGKPILLPLNNFMLSDQKTLSFTSNAAEVIRTRNALTIIPRKEGKFDVLMMDGDKVIDKLIVFATNPDNPEVALMDISGQKVSFENAHRLESVNTFWQVINFDMILVDPAGEQSKFHCATRFLRNELREAEASALPGSTLIFTNIKLIGRDAAQQPWQLLY